MSSITRKDLINTCSLINAATGHKNGELGSYTVDSAYGGHKLYQVVHLQYQVRSISLNGYESARTLYAFMTGYLEGIQAMQELQELEESA